MTYSFLQALEKHHGIYLNEQQRQAAFHKDGPAIVLAVPGAGKTTMLLCRTAHLIIEHQIAPEKILSITFSKAAAQDMQKRFKQIFGSRIGFPVHFSTIHSFAYMVMRDHAATHHKQYTLIEGENGPIHKLTLLKQLYREVNGGIASEDQTEELVSAIGYGKNKMLSSRNLPAHFPKISGLQEIFHRYESYKQKHLLIDYDDMLTHTLQILQESPSLLERYRRSYLYIQVDEAQDTSTVQYEIIRLLAEPRNNLFMVADDDQSIYGFRGASPELLLAFEDFYSKGKVFFMEENFRSPEDIVSTCGEVIKLNKIRYPKTMFTNHKTHGSVKVMELKDEIDQMNYLINQIAGAEDLSNIAILYRNNVSAVPLIDKLDRHNIPFYMKDSKLSFLNHWLVQDILSFLKLSLDPKDHVSFGMIYYKTKGYLSKTAFQYVQENPTLSVFESLYKYPHHQSYQREAITQLSKDFHVLSKLPPMDAIGFIEQDLGYGNYLDTLSKKYKYSLDQLNTLLSHLKSIASTIDDIEQFLTRIQQLKGIILHANKQRPNGVVLSTIHSSKGLEFDSVYIIDLIEGQFPSSSSIDSNLSGESTALEEERRLLYVGMTRARKSLDLLTVKSKNGEPIKASRFINEIRTIHTRSPGLRSSKDALRQSHNASLFSPGALVHHNHFGIGRVQTLHGDKITIHFEVGGTRDLLLSVCLDKNVLHTLP